MKVLKLFVNESTLANAEAILEENGLSVQNIVNVVLKRIEKEGGIDFLFGKANVQAIDANEDRELTLPKTSDAIKMTKTIAKRLFSLHGDKITFASKNKGANNYWANPSFDCLKRDWFLILNDWQRKELHLFKIPANSLNNLVSRADQPNLIDLQIAYNDPTFTDNRSGMSFKQYLINTIKY